MDKESIAPATLPRIGDIVHYQSYGTPNGEYLPEPRAAIVTELFSDTHVSGLVNLAVFNPNGFHLNKGPDNAGVPFAETPTPGHWNFRTADLSH